MESKAELAISRMVSDLKQIVDAKHEETVSRLQRQVEAEFDQALDKLRAEIRLIEDSPPASTQAG